MQELIQDVLLQIMNADTIFQFLGVFIVSLVPFFELYVAIPIGIVFGVPAIPVIIIGALGNWISVMGFVWVIDKLRSKSPKKKKGQSKRWQRAQHYFQKYGVPGVSFAGPMICFHVGAAIAMAAGASKRYITIWQSIAIISWSIALGITFTFGINLLEYIPNLFS